MEKELKNYEQCRTAFLKGIEPQITCLKEKLDVWGFLLFGTKKGVMLNHYKLHSRKVDQFDVLRVRFEEQWRIEKKRERGIFR